MLILHYMHVQLALSPTPDFRRNQVHTFLEDYFQIYFGKTSRKNKCYLEATTISEGNSPTFVSTLALRNIGATISHVFTPFPFPHNGCTST
jgi:hypothetical protein